ncbi:LysE family transporter [Bacillus sp. RG28]|uniref:LysE family transporter n=1 Tax=Gottfriedia endophytica TaxID=2820819 RepID=A0A940NSL4_9BACI|nr:LysE family transporter [Gottfriedia endophytica]MBP0726292.1 LysE family transporter [Gottfriedia endophytica]
MLFIKCFILGFSVSAPVGPIGLLCIQRTLSRGKLAGFFTGLGAVTANLIYASIAALGFSVVSSFLLQEQLYLKVFGAIFLFYLGIKTIMKKPSNQAAKLEGERLSGMYLSTFFLMFTNPVTILNFVAMFAGLGIEQSSKSGVTDFTLITGVFLGATTWWFILSYVVSIFKNKITPHLALVNKIAGVLIVLLGVLAFLK